MATTAKEYKDLNKATTLDKTAMFAVAQEGQEELQTITTEQLAQPIADVLSEGALAELEYATSQGKNAIATALTNKGVSTTASETLIQMADKVNNLNVDNNKESIKVPMVSSVVEYNGSSYFCIRQLPSTGNFILYTGSTLYYVPKAVYTTLADMIAAASFSIDVGSELTSSAGYVAYSMDESKILVRINGTTFKVFSLSDTAFTLLHDTFTVSAGYTSYSSQCAIDNNGTFIVWANTGNYFSAYHIATATETQIPYKSSSETYTIYNATLIVTPNYIYILGAGISTTTSTIRLAGVSYTLSEEGVFTFTPFSNTLDKGTDSMHVTTGMEFKIVNKTDAYVTYCTYTSANFGTRTGLYEFNFNICPVNDTTSVNRLTFLMHPLSSANNSLPSHVPLATKTVQCTANEDGTINIVMPSFGSRYMIYNPIQHTLTLNENNNILISTSSNNGDALVVDNVIITFANPTNSWTGHSTQDYEIVTWTSENKMVGYARTVNELTSYYWPNSLSTTYVNSGYFDIETTITPAVPDEQ